MTLTPSTPEEPNILLLDLEGVMTKGMLGERSSRRISPLFMFLNDDARFQSDGEYSKEATRLVGRLVREHNFRIVLITRHGKNETEILQIRLKRAGILPHWLYRDPDAISDLKKDQGIIAWRIRNPHIPDDKIVVLEDQPDRIKSILPERVIGTNPDQGFVQADYDRLLVVMGLAPKPDAKATGRPVPPAPRA